jgi:hypothetical protein
MEKNRIKQATGISTFNARVPDELRYDGDSLLELRCDKWVFVPEEASLR